MATDGGKNFLKLVEQIRRLCEQIQLLLKTADGLVAHNGWKPLSSQVTNVSGNVEYPRNWVPQTLARYYTNTAQQHLLLFVSVVLDNRDNGDVFFEEPLVSSGWFDYGQENKLVNWEYWWGQCHVYMSERADDGVLRGSEGGIRWPAPSMVFKRASTLALPLVIIRDSEALKTSVVTPYSRRFRCLEPPG